MIQTTEFISALERRGMDFFTGVPDSLLKSFCSALAEISPTRHVIAANEGNAIGLAAGRYLASGRPAVVYFQNSGLGNATNPLLSLADPDVYGIPMLLVIGWRGRPGVRDEPQHAKQGRVTLECLHTMEIPAFILDKTCDVEDMLHDACTAMEARQGPVAFVVCEDTFAPHATSALPSPSPYPMRREEALCRIVRSIPEETAIVSTTGQISRELYEYRQSVAPGPVGDFLTVGSMGHSASIALGVALTQPQRLVVCLDGDGAVLMHMGVLPVIGSLRPQRFVHIVLNNGAHDSVGGQPTAGFSCGFGEISRAGGYEHVFYAETPAELDTAIKRALAAHGPVFLEVRVQKGSRKDLGRPKSSPSENRDAFMTRLGVRK